MQSFIPYQNMKKKYDKECINLTANDQRKHSFDVISLIKMCIAWNCCLINCVSTDYIDSLMCVSLKMFISDLYVSAEMCMLNIGVYQRNVCLELLVWIQLLSVRFDINVLWQSVSTLLFHKWSNKFHNQYDLLLLHVC